MCAGHCAVPRGLQAPVVAAGKERSTEYLLQCLQAVEVRMDTLSKIIGGYGEYIVRVGVAAAFVAYFYVRWRVHRA